MAVRIQVKNHKQCHICNQMIEVGTDCIQKAIEVDGGYKLVHEHEGSCPVKLI